MGILQSKLLGDPEGWRGIQQAKRCAGLPLHECYQMGYGPEVVNTDVIVWKEIDNECSWGGTLGTWH